MSYSARRLPWVILTALFGMFAYPLPAPAAIQADSCASYFAVVRSGLSGSVPVVPAELLIDQDRALPCLVRLINDLHDRVGLQPFASDARSQFLSATGALRTLISVAIGDDEAQRKKTEEAKKAGKDDANPPDSRLGKFIDLFRGLDDTRVATVLVHALRSDDRVMRSNALLILANVVDNTTVCVAIDHLYDADIASVPHGINGRANLLAVVSVVAPWAYRETFYNIEKVLKFVGPRVDSNDPALKYTTEVIQNIKARLGRQTCRSNRAVRLPENERDCYEYKPMFKAAKEQLKYFANPSLEMVCTD